MPCVGFPLRTAGLFQGRIQTHGPSNLRNGVRLRDGDQGHAHGACALPKSPTTLSKDGRSRPPHLNSWRDGWRHLRFMLLFSPRWLFLYPGGVALFLSALIYFAILAGPVDVAGVGLGIHTLLYAQTGMTLGLLSIVFGTCARMFGMREGFLQEHRLLEFVRTSPALEIGGCRGTSVYRCRRRSWREARRTMGQARFRPAGIWRLHAVSQPFDILRDDRRNFLFVFAPGRLPGVPDAAVVRCENRDSSLPDSASPPLRRRDHLAAGRTCL